PRRRSARAPAGRARRGRSRSRAGRRRGSDRRSAPGRGAPRGRSGAGRSRSWGSPWRWGGSGSGGAGGTGGAVRPGPVAEVDLHRVEGRRGRPDGARAVEIEDRGGGDVVAQGQVASRAP